MMTYVKIEQTKETLKSLKIRWANMLKNLLNQENNIFTFPSSQTPVNRPIAWQVRLQSFSPKLHLEGNLAKRSFMLHFFPLHLQEEITKLVPNVVNFLALFLTKINDFEARP